MNTKFHLLPHESILRITGPDSLTFLQGQVTCDTRKLSAKQAERGAYCTPQGRVVCDFLLAQLPGDDCYGLRMRADIVQLSATTFGKYVIFSKAKLDTDAQWIVVACWGDSAAATIEGVYGGAPDGALATFMGEDFAIVQTDANGEYFECYLRADAADTWLESMAGAATEGSPGEWQAAELRWGLARIEATTSGEYVPQVLNYDITGHIAFDKGCYTGQEVVARLHYRGKSKRRLYLVSGGADQPLQAGDNLQSSGSERTVGQVVNSATCGTEQLALVSAITASVAEGLVSETGAPLTLLTLPYSLES